MGVTTEILRNIQDATEKGNEVAVKVWQAHLTTIEGFEQAHVIEQLPHANQIIVEKSAIALAQETPAVKLTPSEQARQLREALSPFIQEYKAAKVPTPDLVNNTWQGIWKVIGEKVDFEYQVPECDRTQEELAQLRKENRAVLLLPNDIYTPEGLVRLGQAFPLMNSSATNPEVAARISHSSYEGGSIDIEMVHDAPYRTRQGYNEKQLREKIAADGRVGMRLPTYIIGGQFSKLLTGHYFDENTWSRTPESFLGGRALTAYFGSVGRLGVDGWFPSSQDPHLGGRSEGVKRA